MSPPVMELRRALTNSEVDVANYIAGLNAKLGISPQRAVALLRRAAESPTMDDPTPAGVVASYTRLLTKEKANPL